MKRLPLIAIALIACLVPASLALAAGKGKPQKTTSTLNVKYKAANPADPYGKSSFRGKVGPKKCAKGRKVSIKGVGRDKTDAKGRFSIDFDAQTGRYKVKVAPKTVKKGKKRILCTKAKTTLRVAAAG